MRYLVLILSLTLFFSCCDRKIAPQRPSNSNESDTARIAIMELNQRLAIEADNEINAIANRLNDSLLAAGAVPYRRQEHGYWLRIVSPGSGDKLLTDDKVAVSYTLYLPDGTPAEQNSTDITVGRKQVPDAIDLALQQMQRGAKAEIIATWALLYGRTGTENIPPYSQGLISLTVSQ